MFARDFEICRLFGIPLVVGFDVVFLMLFIALSCGNLVWGLLFSLVLVVSIVLHELGHALTARLFRVQVREIRIGMLGGCAELVGRLWRPGHQVAVSLAGPLVNLLAAGALYALALFAPVPPRLAGLLAAAVWTNLVLGGFNLIPGFPLDGGHALMAVLGRFVHRERAAFSIMCVGRGTAVLLALSWLRVVAFHFDVGALLLLAAAVLWIAGGRVLPALLRLWMPEGKALMASLLLRGPLQLVLGFLGFALASVPVRLWTFNLFVAGSIWQAAHAAYREAAWHG